MKEYYDLLGVSPKASLSEIRKAARCLFIENHPDMHSENKAYFEEKTKKLIEAYKKVSDDRRSAMASRAGEESENNDDGADETEKSFEALLIKLSNRRLALRTQHVREIVRMGDVRIEDAGIMAETFPFLVGIFQRRGEVTMLWNLHSQLCLRETPLSSDIRKNKIVVVDWEDSCVGFLVDEIEGFAVFEKDSVGAPDESAKFEESFIEGKIQTEEGAVGLLNIEKLLYNLPL